MKHSLRPLPALSILAIASVAAVSFADDEPPSTRPAATTQPGAASRPARTTADWTLPRGDAQMTGVATVHLPERLAVRWRRELGSPIEGTAAIWNDLVYVGDQSGAMTALELRSGAVRWRVVIADPKSNEPVGIRSSPSVRDGRLFFGDEAGVLHCLDARNGESLWKFTTGGEILSAVNHDAERLYFGSYDGYLYALDPRDGRALWKYETADRVHATPAVVGDVVLSAGCDAYLHVIRAADGQLVRTIDLGAPCGSTAATNGSRTIVGTYAGQVLGLDWTRGEVTWKFTNPERDFPFMSSAAIDERIAVIGGRDKRIYGLDTRTGAERWQIAARGRVDSSAVIVGERVFVGAADGVLLELGLLDGKERWRYECGAALNASPAVVDGALLISTTDGVVYCFGANTDR